MVEVDKAQKLKYFLGLWPFVLKQFSKRQNLLSHW